MTWDGLIVPTPTTISSPASAGIAISSTRLLNNKMTTAIVAPAKSREVRDFAPAAAVRELADMEPPTGMPWNRPAARLPAPWPMKSAASSEGLPSSFGTAAATPAPWTRPTNANDAAGISRKGTSPNAGIVMNGSVPGTSAMSLTSATSRSNDAKTAAIAEETAIATTIPSAPSLVCCNTTIKTTVVAPIVIVGRSMLPRFSRRSKVRAMRLAPSAE